MFSVAPQEPCEPSADGDAPKFPCMDVVITSKLCWVIKFSAMLLEDWHMKWGTDLCTMQVSLMAWTCQVGGLGTKPHAVNLSPNQKLPVPGFVSHRQSEVCLGSLQMPH